MVGFEWRKVGRRYLARGLWRVASQAQQFVFQIVLLSIPSMSESSPPPTPFLISRCWWVSKVKVASWPSMGWFTEKRTNTIRPPTKDI